MKIAKKYYNTDMFTATLKRQLWKYLDEEIARLILNYYSKEYSLLKHSDKPDLQCKRKSLGIEVVNIKSETEKYIDGNFADYIDSSLSSQKRNKAAENLKKRGISMFFPGVIAKPSSSDNDVVNNIIRAYKNKLSKLPVYREKGFKNIGLFLLNEDPPVNPFLKKIEDALKNIFVQKDYDIIFYSSANRLIVFDKDKNITDVFMINKNDYSAINIKARAIVEEKYKIT